VIAPADLSLDSIIDLLCDVQGDCDIDESDYNAMARAVRMVVEVKVREALAAYQEPVAGGGDWPEWTAHRVKEFRAVKAGEVDSIVARIMGSPS
jgi:hypothetical protein